MSSKYDGGKFTNSFAIEMAKRNVPGHFITVFRCSNTNVSTILQTMWEEGTLYIPPLTAETMTISSTSVNDTFGGTGANTIVVFALDENSEPLAVDSRGFPASIPVVMNGTTGVTIPTDIFRSNRLFVTTVGSVGANDGIIYLGSGVITAGKPAVVHDLITVGKSITHSGKFSIPTGFGLIITEIDFFVESSKQFFFNSRTIRHSDGRIVRIGPFPVPETVSQIASLSNVIPSQHTVILDAVVSQQTGAGFMTIAGVLIKNEYLN